jgi:rhamnosyltransferase
VKLACIFAHYDRDNTVDDYVFYYLKSLRDIVDTLVFVTTVSIDQSSIDRICSLGINLIQRKNEGYDFYSYKVGIEALSLGDYDEVILCNDSVYGPLTDIGLVVREMREKSQDFWGITDSFDFAYHLQSYFMVFGFSVLKSSTFTRFWDSVEILDDKKEIIRRYEVGLTQCLRQAGFVSHSMTSFDDVGKLTRVRQSWRSYLGTLKRRWREAAFWSDVYAVFVGNLDIGLNPTHSEWRSLLQDYHVPFIKVELLRDNPRGVGSLDAVGDVVRSLGDYPVSLIDAHLARVGDSRVVRQKI